MRVAGDVDRLRERARVAVRRRDDHEIATRLDRERPARERRGDLLVEPRILGERVDQPSRRMPDLDQAELVDVARDGRLHDVVALAPQRVGELGLRRDRSAANESQDRGVPLGAVHASSTSVRVASAWSISSGPTTSGGASRSTFAPEVRQTSPTSSAASTTGCAGRSSSAPTSKPAPRTSTTPGRWRSPSSRRAPLTRTAASKSSSIVAQTASAAAQTTGLPPNV